MSCISNCNVHNCGVNAKCTITPDAFTCECNEGHVGDGYECSVDYCVANNCSANAFCSNLRDGFSCACKANYTGNGHSCVPTCDSSGDCQPNAECLSSVCTCRSGYVEDNGSCIGSNVCSAADQRNCSKNALCSKETGSPQCVCKHGYVGDGYVCDPVCDVTAANCSAAARCVSASGSYACLCADGYLGEGDNCTDVNECQSGADNNCSVDKVCINTGGGFECTCKNGFVADGHSCYPECNSTADCEATATCVAVGNAYGCICSEGYSVNGVICEDVDECSQGTHNCSDRNCTNTPGGFSCECRESYIDRDGQCFEACNSTADCETRNACVNAGTLASYCDCAPGYTGADPQSCSDIDECSVPDICHVNAVCVNSQGSYACQCTGGYVGDGHNDCFVECDGNPARCHENAQCYSDGRLEYCKCCDGFIGDGVNCVAQNRRPSPNVCEQATWNAYCHPGHFSGETGKNS